MIIMYFIELCKSDFLRKKSTKFVFEWYLKSWVEFVSKLGIAAIKMNSNLPDILELEILPVSTGLLEPLTELESEQSRLRLSSMKKLWRSRNPRSNQ